MFAHFDFSLEDLMFLSVSARLPKTLFLGNGSHKPPELTFYISFSGRFV